MVANLNKEYRALTADYEYVNLFNQYSGNIGILYFLKLYSHLMVCTCDTRTTGQTKQGTDIEWNRNIVLSTDKNCCKPIFYNILQGSPL